MVSVLGDYSYSFPNYIKLEKRLKDYLEDEVDEKYYLSAKFLDCMLNGKSGKVDRKKQFMHYIKPTNDKDIASTITTRETNVATSNFIVDTIMVDLKFSEKFQKKHQSQISPTLLTDTRLSIVETICLNSKVNGKQPSLQDKIYDIDGVSTAVTTSFMPSIAIPEATKQGYALAKDGDGVYLNRPHQKRGVVQDQMIQTIKTSGNDIGVVTNNLRIRKLTPLECWRLMGISDDDFNKAQASGVSNSQLYKQAGNAIVVDVFEAILRRMIT
jgi:DNA (cytosine-5)-methyltransferase 1